MRNTLQSLAPSPSRPKDKAVLRSVTNALATLEAFRLDRPELGVTELSQRLGFGKSAVHRLLTSLASRGYVSTTPHSVKYCLGLECIAAPLRDHAGAVVASLGVACLAVRLPEERLASMAGLVRDTPGAASAALGFKEPRR